MATVLNKRDVALQAASPRTVAVNLGTTVNVNGTLNGTAVATVVTNADAGASHAGLTGNPHNASLTQIAGDLDDISNGSTYFKTTANQVTGSGRAYNALDSSNEYIKSLTSTKMTLVGSNPSTGWVGDGNGIRMYQGGVLKVNIPVSGAPSFSGDITGGSNISITGTAAFAGSTNSGGVLYCGVFNDGGSVAGGLLAKGNNSGGFGVHGKIESGSSLSVGVKGQNTGGRGIEGSATTGTGVYATSSSGTALHVQGPMTISSSALVSNLRSATCLLADNSTKWGGFSTGSIASGASTATFTATNKPGSNSSNTWWTFTNGATTIRIPVWLT